MSNTNTKSFSLRQVARVFSNGGVLLMFVAVLALYFANSPWADRFNEVWQLPVLIQIGSIKLFCHHGEPMSLISFINDALMAIFFFSVGLEIKREVLIGELSSPKKALLPIVAAIGGMVVPVSVFYLFSPDFPASNGLPIPMATDIAFSLGILSMLGKRVPISLKVFLTTLAVVDDIGGIIIIALKYNSGIEYSYLLLSLFMLLVLVAGGYFKIYAKMFYLVVGFVIWTLFLQSGIHPTIAGVLIAFTIPARPKINIRKYVSRMKSKLNEFPMGENESIILTSSQIDTLKYVEDTSDKVIGPLQELEDALHPIVAYLIMPLFAFANAGVSLRGLQLMDVMSGVSLSVILGLFAGKFIGIFSFTYAYVKSGLCKLPDNINLKQIAGVATLGGIGFTVSLFIANLSYESIPDVGVALLNQAKLGIIVGSLLSGVTGYLLLKAFLPTTIENEIDTDSADD